MTRVDLGNRYEAVRALRRDHGEELYLVRDRFLARNVVLTLFSRPPELERCFRELSWLAEVDHPGLARVLDFGCLGEQAFFTRELVGGRDLGGLKRITKSALLAIARDLAAVLAFLHRHGIHDIDLAPRRILAPANGARSSVVVVDCNASRRHRGRAVDLLAGSPPAYVAPERVRGEAVGPWTDVYAFGAILQRLATVDSPRQPPVGRCRDETVNRVLVRALAADPRQRFSSGVELSEALGAPENARDRTAALPVTVGRAEELSLIDHCLNRSDADPRAPRAILITGAAGLGQSHLIREARLRAQLRGWAAHVEVGHPGRATAPGEVLRALGVHLPRSAARVRERWDGFLARLGAPRRQGRLAETDNERRLRWAQETGLVVEALAEPALLAVDGLEHFDEVSIALVTDVVRRLAGAPPQCRLCLMLGYREVGPSRAALRELTGLMMSLAPAALITLRPLGVEDSLALYARHGGVDPRYTGSLQILEETAGVPSRVVSAATGVVRRSAATLAASRPASTRTASGPAQQVLEALLALERPAAPEELRRLAGLTRRRFQAAIDECRTADWIARAGCGDGPPGALAATPAAREQARLDPVPVARLHRRLAQALGRRGHPAEALRHWRSSGSKLQVARWGVIAARHFRATLQHRAALDAIGAALAATPSSKVQARALLSLEAADLHARVGDLDAGVALLESCLPAVRRRAGGLHARVLLGLAALHARRGKYRQADALFRAGFALPGAARLASRERLLYLNEHAAMKAVTGEHDRALALCEQGLRLAGKSRAAAVLEVVLNLHATRANVALRRHDYDAAVEESERALEIAAAVGSQANQAAILNNLGIIHGQCDRHAEAVRTLREAERTCLRLDEGPPLVSIYGNLAVLHAKLGDFAEADRRVAGAERLARAAGGRRQELLVAYSAGVVRLHQGRPLEARPPLDAALASAQAMGDRHLSQFGEAYLREAQLLTGAYAPAWDGLTRLALPETLAPVRRMALARHACLAGWLGLARQSAALAEEWTAIDTVPPVPFLQGWDRLFLAWGASARGDVDAALEHGVTAERYFLSVGLGPAAALASFVLAECRWLHGREAGAGAASPAGVAGELTRALFALLEAARIRRAGLDAEGRTRLGSLLSIASSTLTPAAHPEWHCRLQALRAAPGGEGRQAGDEPEAQCLELVQGLPEAARAAYAASSYRRLWLERVGADAQRRSAPQAPARAPVAAVASPPPGSPATACPARDELICRSQGMKRLARLLDRLQSSDASVLITGETGSGKELVARVIHRESRRARGPFVVLDCAAMPPALLEAEVFGARRGAFTGLERDRPGLLRTAAGGTVLVDEVADLPGEVQAKLLRLLGAGEARAVGSDETVRVDVRFLFTTARDLSVEQEHRRLRPDLAFRLGGVTLEVPPLRERPEDLDELVEALTRRDDAPALSLAPGALARLRLLPFPGNVRELKNLLARLQLETPGPVTAEDIGRILDGGSKKAKFPANLLHGGDLTSLTRTLEREFIAYHFRRLGGDTGALCRFLGLNNRRQLYRRCARLGLALREVLGSSAPGAARRP